MLMEIYSKVDAVYIASPHLTHADYIRKSLLNGKHVLCEKPLVLSSNEALELYELANERNLILMEGIKTAYAPAFQQLMAIVKSGAIGPVRDIEASFTKLMSGNFRELSVEQAGGSKTNIFISFIANNKTIRNLI
jgi:predicted dehydrogenase